MSLVLLSTYCLVSLIMFWLRSLFMPSKMSMTDIYLIWLCVSP